MASERARKVLADVLELSDAERAELATEILRSLGAGDVDEDGEPFTDEWQAEFHDRANDLVTGRVQPVSHEEAMDELSAVRAELQATPRRG